MERVSNKGVLPKMNLFFTKSILRFAVVLLAIAASAIQAVPQHAVIGHLERGEELVYEAEFSRAVLRNIDVADFRFSSIRVPVTNGGTSASASPKQPDPAYSLQFVGEIKSKGFFSRLFNLNFLERVISIVEPGSFSLQSTKRFDQQGKRVRTSETVYDRETRKIVWTERDPKDPSREPRVARADLVEQVQDVLSAIYFLRTQPLAVGKTIQISISDSGNVYQVPVKVMERRRLKTVVGRVDSFMVDVQMFGAEKLITKQGQFSIWLTADERRIPVKAKLKTEYGTFDITLKRLIRNPSTLPV